MLEETFTADQDKHPIFHSDQNWRYQHDSYHPCYRKENSPDNGMIEAFFGILKYKMFYRFEKRFTSLEKLEEAIVNYIKS